MHPCATSRLFHFRLHRLRRLCLCHAVLLGLGVTQNGMSSPSAGPSGGGSTSSGLPGIVSSHESPSVSPGVASARSLLVATSYPPKATFDR